MKGFSHADRIAGRLNLLDPKRIQDTICKGKDIFGMFPEAYSVSNPNSTTTIKFLNFLFTVYRAVFSNVPPTVSGD
jgi:Glycosyltransferase family 17